MLVENFQTEDFHALGYDFESFRSLSVHLSDWKSCVMLLSMPKIMKKKKNYSKEKTKEIHT